MPLSRNTPDSRPVDITPGPDGNLWFTEYNANKIRGITTDGVFLPEIPIPMSPAGPHDITTGPDGNLWFTEQDGNKIGRVNLDHDPIDITEFGPVPTPNSIVTLITAAPDGNIWFTEQGVNKIGRITPTGAISELSAPTETPRGLGGITVGPDSNIWFGEELAGKMAKLYLLSATGTTLTATTGQRFAAVVSSFHDDEPGMVALNYTALVDWGDGSPLSTGGVSDNRDGTWDVAASHTYADPGSYPVTVSIFDTHPGGLTATATSTVVVTAPGPAPSGNGGEGAGAEFASLAVALPSASVDASHPARLGDGGQGPGAQAASGAAFRGVVAPLAAQQAVAALPSYDAGSVPPGNTSSPGHRLTPADPLQSLDRWNPALLDLLAANLLAES
jgi:hypothetical protein